jgi:hypothetical protein
MAISQIFIKAGSNKKVEENGPHLKKNIFPFLKQ